MENNSKALNPWLSIWFKPRSTIQQIIDTNPKYLVFVLMSLSGFSQVLDRASVKNMGDKYDWPMIVLIAAVVGPVVGIFSLYAFGWLVRWTGKWIKGKSSPVNIRAAIAWSSVPTIWVLILWVPEILLFGQELFTAETPAIEASPYLSMSYLGFAVVGFVAGIWAFVIFLKCLGQVQGFSAWKALGNTILALLVIIAPFAVLFIALFLTAR